MTIIMIGQRFTLATWGQKSGVLIDSDSALSIMLVRLMQFLHISISKLGSTTTTSHGYKAVGP